MNEELDSQLSAMFDDELPAAECELLARRLSRDEQLKARWGRYAIVGAVIRAERGVRLNAPLAGRISAQLLAEPALESAATPVRMPRARRWWQPLAASALAASVAALCVLWLRAQVPGAPLTAKLDVPAQGAVLPVSARTSPDSYTVPPPSRTMPVSVPNTELANYVVAHSMVAPPVTRRNLLSAFMSSEPAATQVPEGNVQNPAQ
jgi:sigma-E factor negative regulatory protein RseA